MTSTPESVDERLTTAHDLALAALREVTPATTVGDTVDYVIEADGVVSLRFATTQRRRRLAELEIPEAHLLQRAQLVGDRREVLEQRQRLAHREVEHVRHVERTLAAFDAHLQDLGPVGRGKARLFGRVPEAVADSRPQAPRPSPPRPSPPAQ